MYYVNILKSINYPDKYYTGYSTDLKKRIQKHLLLIHKLALEFPNSGSVRKELLKLYKKLYKRDKLNENIGVLISIVADLAFKNPSTYPVSSAILSKLFTFISDNKKTEYMNKLIKRFDSIPNTGIVDL